MSTKRRRINRPVRRPDQFSPAALDAFRKMVALECTCPPRDWEGKYWEHEPCAGCEEWWQHHRILHRELRLSGGREDWPAIRNPNARSPYPEGCEADKHWKSEPKLEAQERYRALAEAAGLETYEEDE